MMYQLRQPTLCISGSVLFLRPQEGATEINSKYLFVKNASLSTHKDKGLPQQAQVTQGVPSRLRPQIFLTLGTTKVVKSSALRTGRLYPRRNPLYSFLEAESTPGNIGPSVATRKIPSD